MAATIHIKRTVVEKKLTGLSGCLSVVFNCGGERNDKVIEVSHDADVTLTVSQKAKSGAVKSTFTVKPGETHTLMMDDNYTVADMNADIRTWGLAFGDSRAFKVQQQTVRTKEGAPDAPNV